jgi:hypothetical protein
MTQSRNKYNILIIFGVRVKLVRPIIMCSNETYSEVYIRKNLTAMFPIWNVLKQGDSLSPLFLNLSVECTIRNVQEN